MSQETTEWLNTQTLIGFTDQRGKAWHYDESFQGDESNHYAGAIPVEDVLRRIFNWKALEGELCARTIDDDGVHETYDPSRKAIVRSDNGAILGVFKSGYAVHQYSEWLLDQVAIILADDLGIGSAGLLRKGGVAWVSVEIQDNVVTPSGVEFRPHLIAATSHDGTMATTYKRSSTLVVCDNTLAASLNGVGESFKVKHSRYSSVKLQDARDALGIIFQLADEFSQQVEALCSQSVSEGEWKRFLDGLVPVPADEGRARTMAENKRSTLSRLYREDERSAPWVGTSFGVLQAVNTYEHHESQIRSVGRAERNRLREVRGEFDDVDSHTLEVLEAVLA